MSGIMCAIAGNGAAGSNTILIAAGSVTSGDTTWDGYGTAAFAGSPSDFGGIYGTGAVAIFGGATLTQCFYVVDTFFGYNYFYLAVSGDQRSASWNSIAVDGTTFLKSSLSVSYIPASNTTVWNQSYISGDPFTSFPSTIVFT